jgi:murein L,D-transpeptidase YcbB/YkuD
MCFLIKTLKLEIVSLLLLKFESDCFLTAFKTDSQSLIYEPALADAIVKFKKTRGIDGDKLLYGSTLNYLSTPVSSLIKTLVVNMERCRWVSKTLARRKN